MSDPTDSYNVTAEADQAHDDKWLADAVVALGVGAVDPKGEYEMWTRCRHEADYLCIDEFVRDWRVAGALMEKMPLADTCLSKENKWIVGCYRINSPYDKKRFVRINESLPRAIIEACVECLK